MAMVEDQFLRRDWGDERKRLRGHENPVHPAKELQPEILLENGEPKRKSDDAEGNERFFHAKLREGCNL
eukprot:8943619-Alexandrium_andersonii.AAC.1